MTPEQRPKAVPAKATAKSEPAKPRRICRTIEEIRQAGYEAAAEHAPLTAEEKTRLLALLAPYRDQLIKRRAS